MAKNSKDAYGATGKGNVLKLDPDLLTLVTDPAHPLYDSRVHWPLDENMVRNVFHHGINTPIEVSKNPDTGDVEVVVGRQRVKWAREANRRRREQGLPAWQIPAVVRQVAARNRGLVLSGVMAMENAIRQQETPISRAEKMAAQLALGRSEEETAIIFGVEIATIRSSLKLLECSTAVQDAIEAGQINVTHALRLSKLSPDEQRVKVKELIDAGAGATGHTKARAQRAVVQPDKPRMKTRKEILAELEVDPSGERGRALRWVLGMEEASPTPLPGLESARAAVDAFDAQVAA